MSTARKIPLFRVHMPADVDGPLLECLHSGQVNVGPNVAKFEAALGGYVGSSWLTSTSDVFNSLLLSLKIAGVGAGDEVLASPMACTATNMPALQLGAHLRWCDVDPGSGNICVDDLQAQISDKTKVILLYHWAGNPVDLLKIQALARERGIRIIEDAGEAMGASVANKRLGGHGIDFTVFSFNAIRHLTTVEGGAIAFGRQEDFERARWLKRLGIHQPSFRDSEGEIDPRSDIPEAGFQAYLHHVGATLGLSQMQHLPSVVAAHQENGHYFDETLSGIPGISIIKRTPDSQSAFWIYTLLADRRDELLRSLKSRGIHASRVHLRNDVYGCFKSSSRELSGVDAFENRHLSIPCGWWVTPEDRQYIVKVIQDGW